MKASIFYLLFICLTLGTLHSFAQDSLSNTDAYKIEVNDVFEYKLIRKWSGFPPKGKRITILSKLIK